MHFVVSVVLLSVGILFQCSLSPPRYNASPLLVSTKHLHCSQVAPSV